MGTSPARQPATKQKQRPPHPKASIQPRCINSRVRGTGHAIPPAPAFFEALGQCRPLLYALPLTVDSARYKYALRRCAASVLPVLSPIRSWKLVPIMRDGARRPRRRCCPGSALTACGSCIDSHLTRRTSRSDGRFEENTKLAKKLVGAGV
jgi:hypothetical protein